uniref:Plastid ribosomal protein S6 n=1 Tax=Chlamydomonas leiostraca TaxID=1034604 RepID=A0A7S0WV86_9CHLO|mmetsp:Transcript_30098/g.76665  ORF Transcript_30098/g.76665 Transcript_30098/m.76665 type:complete len:178 (+) Transcript_30098:32-565(+)|eukprot:CAMPEP_0202862606 /NCGR_PEP_ID=MMETSP1391-20130828/3585_1 /ASSEMBLY_ACC=CAM_ASM_000867 /TAXON_ID=1034604 /ORGANISM="Chlamydomonas leiostraca, Strain SAG 11-49" /LENGTH=177 /DNA_ID=CAMNT_0049542159 /DNA_START=16 /DNA_END=549 /DNA_ORIENTATION=+
MAAVMQKQATVATKASARLAPVAKPVALRHSFRTGALNQVQRNSRVVVARAAQVMDEEALVVGMDEAAQAELLKLPKGYHWYETMMILKPTMSEEDRDRELAKFEAFLNKEDCQNINALVRGRSRMAYPIKQHWEGIYVLYTYAARRTTARTIQQLLSNPEAGSEDNVLRHITFCKY